MRTRCEGERSGGLSRASRRAAAFLVWAAIPAGSRRPPSPAPCRASCGPWREPVGEHRADRVVGLVLEAPCQQPVALEGHRLAVQAGAGHPGVSGRAQSTKAPGNDRQPSSASSSWRSLPSGSVHVRVAHHAHRPLARRVGTVEDEDRLVDADLAGGETDSLGGVHRGDHVGDQRVQRRRRTPSRGLRAVHHRRAPAGDRRTVPPSGSRPYGACGASGSWPEAYEDRVSGHTRPLAPGKCNSETAVCMPCECNCPESQAASTALLRREPRPDRLRRRRHEPAGPERPARPGRDPPADREGGLHGHPQRVPHGDHRRPRVRPRRPARPSPAPGPGADAARRLRPDPDRGRADAGRRRQ